MTYHPVASYTDGVNSEENKDGKAMNQNRLYQITLAGEIDHTRKSWFEKLGFDSTYFLSNEGSLTVLTGQVIDQAHLRGFLNKLWDLNFEVVQVTRLETIEDRRT